MPTYSYRCTECDTAFDIQQAFTDDSLTVCPTCGGKLRKVFNAVGVSFTGSGFYRNDSRPARTDGGSSSSSSSSSSDSSKPAASSAPAATKTESPGKSATPATSTKE
jgi:putative FmdB family regulatory protein